MCFINFTKLVEKRAKQTYAFISIKLVNIIVIVDMPEH